MGGCVTKPQTAPEPPAPAPPVHATRQMGASWSKDTLNAALAEMPAALELAESGELGPAQPLPKPLSASRAAEMFEWGFDIWEVPYAELPALAYCVLTAHPELSAPISKIDHEKLWRYVCEVAARYHERPFHSFRHAVDVLLATSSLLRLVQRDHSEALNDPIVVAALLVAALAHDINHPGCMNGFFVATEHPLAAESSAAVLERHHAALALALIGRPQLDFLSDLDGGERDRFVGLIKEVVLATDVTTTMPKAKEFKALVEGGGSPSAMQVVALLIKAADISNPARRLPVYGHWIDGVMSEFFAQGDAERQSGLPISMNCDRDTVDANKAQVGFITFLVAPLFAAVFAYAPALKPITEQLEANRAHFASLAK